MSDRNRTSSSFNPFGTLIGPTSAKGTRAYCACPPAYPPYKCEYPNSAAPVYPYIASSIQAFGFVLSQADQRSCLQKKQFPQQIVKGTTTLSPTFNFFTSGPTSTTSPINS